MILQSLRELALREGLVEDPAFESKPVRWVIQLRPDGRLLQIYDTNEPQTVPEGSKRKPKLEAKLMLIPRRCVRSVGIRANFLVDNAKYVLAVGAEGETDPKNAQRHAAYRRLLHDAQTACWTPQLAAVLAFLDSPEQRSLCLRKLREEQGGFADNDLFTFELATEYLHEVEALRHYWTAPSAQTEKASTAVQCLVCGEQRTPTELHNQIQIRGASTSGVPLVSFNATAFEKYGWSGNENAPVCSECMTAYVESLRRLTRARYITPRDGLQVTPLSTVLNGDTTAIYWADAESEMLAAVSCLRDDPKRVKDLLDSPQKGTPVNLRDSSRFFCLVLTGVQGRAVMRRVHTGTVEGVQTNLRRYFAATDVERFDRSAPLPQSLLLRSMVLNGELDRLPAELATELWLGALFGMPLSRTFLSAVVTRNRADRKVTSERAALLHFYFETHTRQTASQRKDHHDDKTHWSVQAMSLDPACKDSAYLLGRLLAVLENLQTAAQGQGLNRTLVDRTFGAASTRPGVVFPQLIQTAQHHLSKAGKKLQGRTTFLNKLMGEIIDGLELNGFSATLNLEQQGRFALGYYHQRQSFYRPRADAVVSSTPEPAGPTTMTEEETAA